MLIIGGTGMLKEASEYFIQREKQVSLVSRNLQKLETFKNQHPDKKVCTLALDYTNTENFIHQLKTHFEHIAICQKVICWMHNSGHNTLKALFNLLNNYPTSKTPKTPIQFYHILGSASRNPTNNQLQIKQFTNIRYRTIVLGFKLQGNYSRWLTHKEISDGVISAVESSSEKSIIGQIEPWHLHP